MLKDFIRKTEAYQGARYAGLEDDHIHFLDHHPFTGNRKNKKGPGWRREHRTDSSLELLQQVKPHQIFAAGDFADPVGLVQFMLFKIILAALYRLKTTEDWVKDCWLWMYRGAWHEFETWEIEMSVPLSPQEVIRKRNAIFKHQSQKDRPVFPGDDAREFWVRAEDRTRETAKAYDKLGMAEYEAMEAFVRYIF